MAQGTNHFGIQKRDGPAPNLFPHRSWRLLILLEQSSWLGRAVSIECIGTLGITTRGQACKPRKPTIARSLPQEKRMALFANGWREPRWPVARKAPNQSGYVL